MQANSDSMETAATKVFSTGDFRFRKSKDASKNNYVKGPAGIEIRVTFNRDLELKCVLACLWHNKYTESKDQISEENKQFRPKQRGTYCQGFIKDIDQNGRLHRYKIPCLYNSELTLDTGVFIRSSGNYNGICYCCEGLKGNLVVNPM
ncbi:hypothetical protein HDV05_004556, partial [Chytridiales sp. JEL 0842]